MLESFQIRVNSKVDKALQPCYGNWSRRRKTSEFKPAKIRLKINSVSHPPRWERIYIYIYIFRERERERERERNGRFGKKKISGEVNRQTVNGFKNDISSLFKL